MPAFADVFLPDALVVRSTRSPDAQVITSIVQNLVVTLDAAAVRVQPRTAADPPLAASRTAALLTALAGDEAEVTIQVKIQGHAELQPGARAALVSRPAGVTFVDDVTPHAGADFEFVHTIKAVPKSGLLTTLTLLVDRDWVEGKVPGALVSVNLVEFTFDGSPCQTQRG